MKHLVTIYTRTPLHLGSGSSVDVVDLPIMRERTTGFPVIPGSSLKGVLRDEARHAFPNETKDKIITDLFGYEPKSGDKEAFSGSLQVMEAKILAFPVRSLAGCFTWLVCPATLQRFQRDTGTTFAIPKIEKGKAIIGSDLKLEGGNLACFEEFSYDVVSGDLKPIVDALKPLCPDTLWQDTLDKRLALVSDEDFTYFVTNCTEIVSRIKIDPDTRTVKTGALFNQENVPSEALFYSVLSLLEFNKEKLSEIKTNLQTVLTRAKTLQIGGDATTGHGICSTHTQEIQ